MNTLLKAFYLLIIILLFVGDINAQEKKDSLKLVSSIGNSGTRTDSLLKIKIIKDSIQKIKTDSLNKIRLIKHTNDSIAQAKRKMNLWSVDRLSKPTLYLQKDTIINGQKYSVGGSGTLITYQNRFFILTADHVSKQIGINGNIIFHDDSDRPIFCNLFSIKKTSWISHPFADVSLIELDTLNPLFSIDLRKKAFPITQIYQGQNPPSKESDLTILGYPLVSIQPNHFSPIVVTDKLASGLLSSPRADTKAICDFLFLDKPSIQGMSGGAVYFSVDREFFIGIDKTLMIGIMHGTFSDNTGGKLSMVTPSFYIWDILKNL